jgi:hypothetical protein
MLAKLDEVRRPLYRESLARVQHPDHFIVHDVQF